MGTPPESRFVNESGALGILVQYRDGDRRNRPFRVRNVRGNPADRVTVCSCLLHCDAAMEQLVEADGRAFTIWSHGIDGPPDDRAMNAQRVRDFKSYLRSHGATVDDADSLGGDADGRFEKEFGERVVRKFAERQRSDN
jgi:hypothetical protein